MKTFWKILVFISGFVILALAVIVHYNYLEGDYPVAFWALVVAAIISVPVVLKTIGR